VRKEKLSVKRKSEERRGASKPDVATPTVNGPDANRLSGRAVPGVIGFSPAPILVVFNPQTPDRNAAIAGRGPSPAPHLRESALCLQQMGATHFALACNTAHHFLREALDETPPVTLPLVDMIEETARAVATAEPRLGRVGILATTGTLDTRLYQEALARHGLSVVVPDRGTGQGGDPTPHRLPESDYAAYGVRSGVPLAPAPLRELIDWLVMRSGEQEGLISEAIFGAFGIKAGFTGGIAGQLMEEAARRLAARGAECLLLGCTEIPLVLKGEQALLEGRQVVLVDPTSVVARLLPERGPRPGIAGGLGPEATVDLLEKMEAPRSFTGLLRAVLRAAVSELGASRDQDHLKMLAIASKDPADAAMRLAEAGADFLVAAPDVGSRAAEGAAKSGLDLIVGGAQPDNTGREVVRRAACTSPAS
jgi:aspartate/glutamate racemase